MRTIAKGTTIHTVTRHVSKSGMTRELSFYVVADGDLIPVTALIAHMGGVKWYHDRNGHMVVKVKGTGMDMAFNVLYNVGYHYYGDGYAFKVNHI